MEEGAARLFVAHTTEKLFFVLAPAQPLPLTRLSGFPRNLHFVATPLYGPQEAIFVSAYRYRLTSTILAPAPGHSGHFLVLLVHPDTEQLPGVPVSPGMVLYPQRRLAHGDVLVPVLQPRFIIEPNSDEAIQLPEPASQPGADERGPRGPPPPALSRATPGSSSDTGGRGGTALAQLPDLKAKQHRRCVQFAALSPADTAGCECHQGVVVCEDRQEQRGEFRAAVAYSIWPQVYATGASCRLWRARRCTGASGRAPGLGPSPSLSSGSAPTACPWSHICGSQDMIAFALGDHSREALADLVESAPLCNARAKAGWGSLPWLPPEQQPDCLLLFTDGSYHPVRDTSSWAVVALGTFQGSPYRLGAFAGRVPPGDGAPSSFRGEVRAILHAFALALCLRVPHTVLASDSQSAIDVCFGRAHHAPDDSVSAAAISLLQLATHCGSRIDWLKVASHTGCAFNDAAGGVAKTTNLPAAAPEFAFEGTALQDAIRERTVHFLWLAAGSPQVGLQLPWHGDTGTWTAAACSAGPCTSPASKAVAQAQRSEVPWTLSFQAVSYNCLSARGPAARELLDTGLHSRQAAFAGLQEARPFHTGIDASEHYWAVSSSGDSEGRFGCQLWLSKTLSLGSCGGPAARFVRESFAVHTASPRCLTVLVRAGPLRFAFTVAHALTAASPQADIQGWWHSLQQSLASVPHGYIPVVLLDGNAKFRANAGAPGTLDSEPMDSNAAELLEFCRRFELRPTDQFDHTGARLFSWRSPSGSPALLDYVLLPAAWSLGMSTRPARCLGDLHAGFDHWPVTAAVRAEVAAPQLNPRPRFNQQALATTEGQAIAAAALSSAPVVPWEVDSTTHVDVLHRHLQHRLSVALPAPSRAARNPAIISSATLEAIYHRRGLRTVSGRSSDKLLVFQAFSAWMGRRSVATACARRQQDLADRRLLHAAEVVAANRAVSRGLAADRAAFVHRATDEARSLGPSAFAHRIRALLRCGRRYKPPQLLCPLQVDGKEVSGEEAVLASLGRHFAGPERAELTTASAAASSFAVRWPARYAPDAAGHFCPLPHSTPAASRGVWCGSVPGLPQCLLQCGERHSLPVWTGLDFAVDPPQSTGSLPARR